MNNVDLICMTSGYLFIFYTYIMLLFISPLFIYIKQMG